MTSLARRLLSPRSEARSHPSITLAQYMEQVMQYGGLNYGIGNQTLTGTTEDIASSFQGYVEGAYKSNGIVFACCVARMLIFSEARFQYQRMRNGRPGDLFSNRDLAILETPWPNGTTGDLLSRAISDVDLAGNSYTVRLGRDRLKRARPDWVTILIGSKRPDWEPGDLDGEVIGYLYHPGGRNSGRDPVALLPENVAHWAPVPDPTAEWRGMSWITPIVREIMGDKAAMEHKLRFFDNGATVNLVAKLPETVKDEAFKRWVALFKEAHEGTANAYETVFLGGGADLTAIGSNMKEIDFKVTQGHGETRIAAAARIPAIIVGLSEGLEAATYANYGQARRAFADATMRPLWRGFAAALASIVAVPVDARLWYDAEGVAFLQEDVKDAADIQQTRAVSIRQLIEAGFTPESVVDAIDADDMRRLEHTGLFSVQLQEPGSEHPNPKPIPAVSGQNGRRLLEQFVASGARN